MDDDKPTTPNDGRVSFAKKAAAPARPGLRGRDGKPKGNLAADGSPMPPPPKNVRYAVLAVGVSALAALIASLSLFGEKAYLFDTAVKSNNKLKVSKRKTVPELHHAVNSLTVSSLVSTLVLIVALGIVARGAWRGRSWARWTVIALWVLATLTGTFASFIYIIGIGSSGPVAFKVPSFVSAASLIAAVLLVSLRSSTAYFALTKPPRPADGAPARRSGLFGPRPARPGTASAGSTRGTAAASRTDTGSRTATTRPARESADRGRSKQRASTESVAKGAELARARAKASKSRRTGV